MDVPPDDACAARRRGNLPRPEAQRRIDGADSMGTLAEPPWLLLFPSRAPLPRGHPGEVEAAPGPGLQRAVALRVLPASQRGHHPTPRRPGRPAAAPPVDPRRWTRPRRPGVRAEVGPRACAAPVPSRHDRDDGVAARTLAPRHHCGRPRRRRGNRSGRRWSGRDPVQRRNPVHRCCPLGNVRAFRQPLDPEHRRREASPTVRP